MAGRSAMSREDDERHLRWLAWRAKGHGPAAIAVRDGTANKNRVGLMTARILEADLAQSGEDAAVVRAAYWKDR